MSERQPAGADDTSELLRRARQLSASLTYLEMAKRRVLETLDSEGQSNEVDLAVSAISLLGVQMTSYLASSLVRQPDRSSRARLAAAVVDLWTESPVEQDAEVLGLAYVSLVAATTHDVAWTTDKRFDERAALALHLADVAGNSSAWEQLWGDGVALGDATQFDLGGVNGNAKFWSTLAHLRSNFWDLHALSERPPTLPDRNSFERALTSAAGAESPSPHSGPTPHDPPQRIELSPRPAERSSAGPSISSKRKVWFATNRARSVDTSGGADFSASGAGVTSYGWCEVAHVGGGQEIPPTSPDRLSLESVSVSPDPASFVASMLADTHEGPDSDRLLLFVHGYNSRFDSTAITTAQLAIDTSARGDVAFFSWPSAGKWYLYGRDANRVDTGFKPLADFLRLLVDKVGFARIDLIVHSLGNRLLASAVEQALAGGDLPIGSLFLAAADVNYPRFRQIAPQIAAIASEPASVYISGRDRALRLSPAFNQDPRVGRGKPIPIAASFDTIDATRVPSNFWGHDYFATTQTVLLDMRAQLAGYAHPDQRGERPVTRWTPDGERYWSFRRPRS